MDWTHRPLVLEAAPLPTEPQPLPKYDTFKFIIISRI